jgi:hypothetical protein
MIVKTLLIAMLTEMPHLIPDVKQAIAELEAGNPVLIATDAEKLVQDAEPVVAAGLARDPAPAPAPAPVAVLPPPAAAPAPTIPAAVAAAPAAPAPAPAPAPTPAVKPSLRLSRV